MSKIIFLIIMGVCICIASMAAGIVCHILYQKKYHSLYSEDDGVDVDVIYARLVDYFREHKPYLNSNLDLKDVASMVGTNRTYLSRAIKENGMVNFNYFVNSYRINEALDIFRKEPMARIGETGSRCGFNSTSAFTMAFKTFLNKTPKQWKQRINGDQRSCRYGKQTRRQGKDRPDK